MTLRSRLCGALIAWFLLAVMGDPSQAAIVSGGFTAVITNVDASGAPPVGLFGGALPSIGDTLTGVISFDTDKITFVTDSSAVRGGGLDYLGTFSLQLSINGAKFDQFDQNYLSLVYSMTPGGDPTEYTAKVDGVYYSDIALDFHSAVGGTLAQNVVATSGSGRFEFYTPSNEYVFLDASITEFSLAVVPEPATLGLFSATALGLAQYRRRCRNAQMP